MWACFGLKRRGPLIWASKVPPRPFEILGQVFFVVVSLGQSQPNEHLIPILSPNLRNQQNVLIFDYFLDSNLFNVLFRKIQREG